LDSHAVDSKQSLAAPACQTFRLVNSSCLCRLRWRGNYNRMFSVS